jgi:hypothetical protein
LLYSNSVLQYFENNSEFLRIIGEIIPVTIILDDVAGSNQEFYSLQNYYGYAQINRFMDIDKLIQQICKAGYQISLKKPYQRSFSSQMIPKIWLGQDFVNDLELPSSWTLRFDKI